MFAQRPDGSLTDALIFSGLSIYDFPQHNLLQQSVKCLHYRLIVERFLEENTGSLDADEVNLNVVRLETVFQIHAALLKEV